MSRIYYTNKPVPAQIKKGLKRYNITNVEVWHDSTDRIGNAYRNNKEFNLIEQREIFKAVIYAQKLI